VAVLERSIAPCKRVLATLQYAGLALLGTLAGETRAVTSVTVTNNGTRPLGVEVEGDATKVSFGGTVAVGATTVFPAPTLTQSWNATARGGARWDGLNIRFRDTA
jgi:hypothetical protein